MCGGRKRWTERSSRRARYLEQYYVTTQRRIPATQTALQAKQCFIHAKAVTKKCKDSRLFRLLLNYSSSREMYPDWSCFELRASFFTAVFFSLFFRLFVMRRQTEPHLAAFLPVRIMPVNSYQFRLFMMQNPIHAKLSPHNALIASEVHPPSFFSFEYAEKCNFSSLTYHEVNVRLWCCTLTAATDVAIRCFVFCASVRNCLSQDCVTHLSLSESAYVRHSF